MLMLMETVNLMQVGVVAHIGVLVLNYFLKGVD
jgi:hypothetical protein